MKNPITDTGAALRVCHKVLMFMVMKGYLKREMDLGEVMNHIKNAADDIDRIEQHSNEFVEFSKVKK